MRNQNGIFNQSYWELLLSLKLLKNLLFVPFTLFTFNWDTHINYTWQKNLIILSKINNNNNNQKCKYYTIMNIYLCLIVIAQAMPCPLSSDIFSIFEFPVLFTVNQTTTTSREDKPLVVG